MKRFYVYLDLGSEAYSYTYITACSIEKIDETTINADGIIIDFGNEILGIGEIG
jgi:hypothetical protein